MDATGHVAARPANTDAGEAAAPTMSLRWARIAIWLVAATLIYNVFEGAIALWSGTRADSIALLGFGLDSLIECAAAGVLLWRLSVQTSARGGEEAGGGAGDKSPGSVCPA